MQNGGVVMESFVHVPEFERLEEIRAELLSLNEQSARIGRNARGLCNAAARLIEESRRIIESCRPVVESVGEPRADS
jgi:hypothetical protein